MALATEVIERTSAPAAFHLAEARPWVCRPEIAPHILTSGNPILTPEVIKEVARWSDGDIPPQRIAQLRMPELPQRPRSPKLHRRRVQRRLEQPPRRLRAPVAHASGTGLVNFAPVRA